MQNNLNTTSLDEKSKSPWLLLLILLLFLFAGTFVFSTFAPFVLSILYGIGIDDLAALISNPDSFENGKAALMAFQAITSAGIFIVTPLLYIKYFLRQELLGLFQFPEPIIRPLVMVVVILFCFMVTNSFIIEWNQGIHFPDFLSSFEKWAQSKEAQLEELTIYLTTFSGLPEYLIAMVVVALIPAIGEELLFRGLIQNIFSKAFHNPHVAIWSAAIIFGAFHLQFYGVVPRILLGALFGYLYYWSGFLSLAMIGHFLNNGLTLTLIYFSQSELIDYDPMAEESSPPIFVVLIFFIAGSVLLYLFRNLFPQKENA